MVRYRLRFEIDVTQLIFFLGELSPFRPPLSEAVS
jgi:hypothetical protein